MSEPALEVHSRDGIEVRLTSNGWRYVSYLELADRIEAPRIEFAEQQAERWERAAAALSRQREEHQAEYTRHEELVTAADAHAERIHAEVATPLIEQAAADGTAYLPAQKRMWEATAARDRAGRFGKRAAHRAAVAAGGEYRTTEESVFGRWGGVPQTTIGIPSWAEAIGHARVDADPRVAVANRGSEQAHSEQQRLGWRRADERVALLSRIPGQLPPSTVEAHPLQWRARANQARHDLTEIEALLVTEAAPLIRVRAARAAAERSQTARAAKLARFRSSSIDHEHPRSGRDHALGL